MKTVKINAAEVVKKMKTKVLQNYNMVLEQIDDSKPYVPEWFLPFWNEFKEFAKDQKEFNKDQKEFNKLIMKRLDNLVSKNNLKE